MEQRILDGVDSSRTRIGYVSILGYSVFGWIEHTHELPVQLAVFGPPAWPVYSTLAPAFPAHKGATKAWASNFYSLADSQIVMGHNASFYRVLTPGPSSPLMILSVYSEDAKGLDNAFVVELAGAAMQNVIAYYDSLPFDWYTMVLELLQPVSPAHGYGFSMEHLNSSSINVRWGAGVTRDSVSTPGALVTASEWHCVSLAVRRWNSLLFAHSL